LIFELLSSATHALTCRLDACLTRCVTLLTLQCLIVLEIAEGALIPAGVPIQEGEVREHVTRETRLRVVLLACVAGRLARLAFVVLIYIETVGALGIAAVGVEDGRPGQGVASKAVVWVISQATLTRSVTRKRYAETVGDPID
jgi:hypothetical protein